MALIISMLNLYTSSLFSCEFLALKGIKTIGLINFGMTYWVGTYMFVSFRSKWLNIFCSHTDLKVLVSLLALAIVVLRTKTNYVSSTSTLACCQPSICSCSHLVIREPKRAWGTTSGWHENSNDWGGEKWVVGFWRHCAMNTALRNMLSHQFSYFNQQQLSKYTMTQHKGFLWKSLCSFFIRFSV